VKASKEALEQLEAAQASQSKAEAINGRIAQRVADALARVEKEQTMTVEDVVAELRDDIAELRRLIMMLDAKHNIVVVGLTPCKLNENREATGGPNP